MNNQKLVDDLFLRDLGKEGIVLSPGDLSYYRTNPIGTRILQILSTSDDISGDLTRFVDDCATRYTLNRTRVEKDVRNFLRRLTQAKILRQA